MTSTITGHWGLPPDCAAAFAACTALTLVLLWRPLSRWAIRPTTLSSKLWLPALAVFAAVASLGYYHFYLRDGPRIIDATYYWLQAKCFAKGYLTLPLMQPTAALRGRFLHYASDAGRLSVLFPPGYAAVLALGMVARVPWLVGPILALFLVLATAGLAERAFKDRRAAVFAGVLSALCATLRYHTADTLSHGWAALLFVVATWGALGNRRRDDAVCGLCCGWLWATRPVSALALLVVVLLLRRKTRLHSWVILSLCTLPGLIAWVAYQRITTGYWLQTTQYAYYALADGPIGCFRYGFGRGIGCHYEHGDYVARRLPESYGFLPALTVSAVRLRWHLLDVFNFEPLALLLLVAPRTATHKSTAWILLSAPLLLLLFYSPFYFDGNFPGGGARLLTDAIPLEHALLAGWLVRPSRWLPVLALSLMGFATHGVFEHHQLRDREGGHPMFERRALLQAGVTHGLILVNTDHGFALGHEPGARDATHGLVVARAHHDAHDRALWKSLGEPDAYYYRYDARGAEARPTIIGAMFAQHSNLRFEAEAEWPVLALADAWAIPGFPPTACVSQQRALTIHPSGPRPAVSLALDVLRSGQYRVRIGWVTIDHKPTQLDVTLNGNQWTLRTGSGRHQCEAQTSPPMLLTAGELVLRLEAGQSPIAIDWVGLEPAE